MSQDTIIIQKKNNSFIRIFLLGVAVGAVTVILFCLNYNRKANSNGENRDSLIYWKNKAGNIIASLRGAEEDFETADNKWKDSIAKVYRTKTKFIKEIVTITEKAEADIPIEGKTEKDYTPVVNCPAIVKNMRQRFKNNYYDASVQIGDSSYMHLISYDTLAVLWKRVKRGLQLDISHANPSIKVEGIKAYRIADKKQKQWAIGLQAGYGFSNTMSPSAYIGIGITKSIIRF